MFDYARQRAKEILSTPQTAVFATSGPAGVQVGEFPCEALDLKLFLLIPRTSDHLYNLEYESDVTLVSVEWELKGRAQVVCTDPIQVKLDLLLDPTAAWSVLVRVDPSRLQVRRKKGWGNLETIDLQ